jgi:DNA-binding HxlR family transcriptional regulator
MLAVWDWERRWGDAGGFALDLVHEPCRRRSRPQLFCARCDQPVRAADLSRRAGPGAGKMSLAARRQRRSSLPGLGDRWSMLLIYAGLRGITRFNEMHAELKVSTHLLSLRLKALVRRGVFERVRYSKRPLRHEYRLTPKGLDVYKLGVFAMYWGDRWLSQAAGAPTIVEHLACGKRLRPELCCNRCGKSLHQSDCHFVEAP